MVKVTAPSFSGRREHIKNEFWRYILYISMFESLIEGMKIIKWIEENHLVLLSKRNTNLLNELN